MNNGILLSRRAFPEGHALAQNVPGSQVLAGGHLKEDRLEGAVVDFTHSCEDAFLCIGMGDDAYKVVKALFVS